MDQIVLFALLGLGTGALIAGIGLGIVLTFRGVDSRFTPPRPGEPTPLSK